MPTQVGPVPYGESTVLNINAATVVKASPGVLYSISVVSGTPSAAGAVYDFTSTTSPQNQFGTIPAAVGSSPYIYNWNCKNGIVVVPPTGTSVVIAVSYT